MTSSATAPSKSRLGPVVFGLLCVGIAVFFPIPYFTLGSSAETWADADFGLADFYAERSSFMRSTLIVHAATAGLALLLSPVQASATIRRRKPVLHRLTGRVSAVAIVIAGVSGLIVGPGGYTGIVGGIGFGALSLIWLYCLFRSISDARARRLVSHRRWSLRVFALTFAAVTLRLWLGLYMGVAIGIGGVDEQAAFDQIYPLTPYLSWIPNLIVIEWYLRRRDRGSHQTRMAEGARTKP